MVDPRNAVLMVVDPQRGFLNEHSRHVVPAIVRLVQAWRAAGGMFLVTRYHNYPGSPYERLLDWCEVHGPPDTDVADELVPLLGQASAVIDKVGYTALNEQAMKVIGGHGWNDIVFCGLDTDTCVLKSAADAFDRGLHPRVAADACASHGGQDKHEIGLLMAKRFIGDRQVLPSHDILRA